MDESYLVGIGAAFEVTKDPYDVVKLQQEVDYTTLTGRPIEEKWQADRETASQMMEQMATMMELNPSEAGSRDIHISSFDSYAPSRRTSSPRAPSRRSEPQAVSRHVRGSSPHSSAQTSVHTRDPDPDMSDIVAACDGQGAPSNATTLQRYTDSLDPYERRILFPQCAWLCANARRGRVDSGSGGLEMETTTPAEAAAVPTLNGEEPEEEEESTPGAVNHDDDDDDDGDNIDNINDDQHGLDTASLRESLRDHSRFSISIRNSRNRLFRVAKVRRQPGAK